MAIVPVITQDHADTVHADPGVVKLFYQESYKYGCHAFNWGASKGMDHFQDVCVVLSDKTGSSIFEAALKVCLPRRVTSST